VFRFSSVHKDELLSTSTSTFVVDRGEEREGSVMVNDDVTGDVSQGGGGSPGSAMDTDVHAVAGDKALIDVDDWLLKVRKDCFNRFFAGPETPDMSKNDMYTLITCI
jgi:hypothetical protein